MFRIWSNKYGIILLILFLFVNITVGHTQTPNYYNIGVREYSSIPNSMILGKVLLNCYGKDSVTSWYERNLNLRTSIIIDSTSNFVKIYQFKASIRTEEGISVPFQQVAPDVISNYLINHKIKFTNCYDPQDFYITQNTNNIGCLENIINDFSKNDTISVFFPGYLKIIDDKSNFSNNIVNLISNSVPITSLENKNLNHNFKYIHNYNQALLYNSLIYLFGDLQVYIWSLKGIYIFAKISVGNNGTPQKILCLKTNLTVNSNTLSKKLLSFWDFFDCKVETTNNKRIETIIIDFKDNQSKLYCPVPIRESNSLIQIHTTF